MKHKRSLFLRVFGLQRGWLRLARLGTYVLLVQPIDKYKDKHMTAVTAPSYTLVGMQKPSSLLWGWYAVPRAMSRVPLGLNLKTCRCATSQPFRFIECIHASAMAPVPTWCRPTSATHRLPSRSTVSM